MVSPRANPVVEFTGNDVEPAATGDERVVFTTGADVVVCVEVVLVVVLV